jgi:PAS domain S-box-containing protein
MLLKTEALQRAIFNSTNFSCVATDERGIIQLFNVGAEHMLGYTAADLVNRESPSSISDPLELEARSRALSLEFGTPINAGFEALVFKASRGIEDIYELTYVRKDGSRLPAIVSVSALHDTDGATIGYLLIGTDNTDRKLVEAERTQVEAKLMQAIAAAEKANHAKTDFLSSMSHELRTPLSAVLGFAQLLETGTPEPTDSQQRSIGQILKAGWYLLSLINEILDLAQVESGKLSLSLEPVALTDVFKECQQMIEPEAQKLGISVGFPPVDRELFVCADHTRIKQIMINLLSNALKYNKPQGNVTVNYQLLPDARLRISVHDTGIGLDTRQMAQLFQPFNRLGQEFNAVEGTGIGLVMTRRLVELLGGVIGVESQLDLGSTFWIELSTTLAPQLLGLVVTHAGAVVVAKPAARRYVLLYVEDNPANLMLVEELVARRPDIRLLCARDGQSGIDLALVSQPDVILMDINLPGINGTNAMIELRRNTATAHIPVVALSANAMPQDIEKGLAAGFFRYLTKPIMVGEFMTTLDQVFAHTDSLHVPGRDKES